MVESTLCLVNPSLGVDLQLIGFQHGGQAKLSLEHQKTHQVTSKLSLGMPSVGSRHP